ncbi:MAG: hypothetical protein ACRBK7_19775 [Acidimicrobiales bacterium]
MQMMCLPLRWLSSHAIVAAALFVVLAACAEAPVTTQAVPSPTVPASTIEPENGEEVGKGSEGTDPTSPMDQYRRQKQLLENGPLPLQATPERCGETGNCLEQWLVGSYAYGVTNVRIAHSLLGAQLASTEAGTAIYAVDELDARHYLAIDRGDDAELLQADQVPEIADTASAALDLQVARCDGLIRIGVDFTPIGCEHQDD